jgi:HK97 family phage prohead protease
MRTLTTKTASVPMAHGLPTGAAPRFTASTDDLDAEHDRIFQEGLSHRDPLVVLFAHESRTLPMGLVTAVHRLPHRTEMSFRWFENDPEVARVRNIFEQGGLSASIGFRVEDAVPNAHGGFDIKKARVHEVSLVPVPANEHARAVAKALGAGRADGDQLVAFEPEDLRAALGIVLAKQLRAVGRRQARAEPVVFVVTDEDPPAVDDRVIVDVADVQWAVATALGQAVSREVKAALNRLTGKVD